MKLCRFCLPFLGLALFAQDASLVLRTSVGFRTQRNSAQLTEEQRQTADKLAAEAVQANAAGKYGEAMRAYYHGMAVMRGVSWTPENECTAGLQGRLDHAIVDPGKPVLVTLTPLYSCQPGVKLTAAVFLTSRREGGSEKSLAPAMTFDASALPYNAKLALPADAAGDYAVEVRLGTTKTLPVHIEALGGPAQRLRDRVAKTAKKSPALPTAEYALTLYERADKGEVNPAMVKLADEFAKANEILDAIDAGRDPFAGKQGDFHKAYRSNVDQTLQPYRVFVPTGYSASKPSGLVVALHGMGGDENSMFDSYNATIKREAERVGLIVACPKGRDSASMYRASAEQDVL